MRQVGFLGLKCVEVELEVVEHAHDVFLQVEIVEGLARGVPQLSLLVAGEEKVEAGVLVIGFERLGLVADFRCIEEVDVAEFEELHVADLAVLVEGDALEAAPHQGLAHHVEVAAERVQNLHVLGRIKGREGLTVSGLGERVVHDLVEAVGDEHVADLLLHLVGVGFDGAADRSMDAARDFDVVVAVDAEDFLAHRYMCVIPASWSMHLQLLRQCPVRFLAHPAHPSTLSFCLDRIVCVVFGSVFL